MTIPRIEHIAGSRYSENIALLCTGCNEPFAYSVRQYKGDFGCNITEFESFLQWAKWEAAKHECFSAGRDVYMPPEPPSELERHASQPDFDQVERHEDPWGGVGYIEEPEDDELADLWDKQDEETDWIDLFEDDEDEEWYEPDIDEDEFGFYAGPILGTVTGRLHDIVRDPYFLLTLTSPAPVEIEITYIEFDYAELEQRVVDEELLKAGVYSLDNHGCLRDEKGRCLACLRPGPHFPFYYKRTQ